MKSRFALSLLLLLACMAPPAGRAAAPAPATAAAEGTGEIRVIKYSSRERVSALFGGDAARQMYLTLERSVRPKSLRGGTCLQITARGIACALVSKRYACQFAVEGDAVIHLPNASLCGTPAGIGVSNGKQ